jgi:CelD/BcsL family acetyltransferase involved in cellulose biosynthesis
MIEAAITGGRSRFDFLKGDEPYKFRLGGVARPLFEVEVSR